MLDAVASLSVMFDLHVFHTAVRFLLTSWQADEITSGVISQLEPSNGISLL